MTFLVKIIVIMFEDGQERETVICKTCWKLCQFRKSIPGKKNVKSNLGLKGTVYVSLFHLIVLELQK